MNEDIHTRIYQLLQQKGISAAQFADTIGVQRSSMSHLLAGRNKPSIDFLQKCIQAYPDVDIQWLITGKQTKISIKSTENIDNLQLNVVKSSEPYEQTSLFDSPQTEYVSKPPIQMQNRKSIERIVTFYTDKTFTEYIPE